MASTAHHADGHHLEPPARSAREVTADLVGRVSDKSSRYWIGVVVLAALFVLGIVGFVLRLSGGFENRAAWGYYVAFFPYLLSTALAAPIVAWATRAAKGQWARTLRRPAELGAAAGILAVLWFIPMLSLIPPFTNEQGAIRFNIWFEWPVGAPHLWNFLAVLFTALLGLAILYVSALPDLAATRDLGSGLGRALAPGWRGTGRQWHAVQHGVAVLGAFFLLFWVFTQYLISIDFSESLIPGYFSSIYPAYNAVTGLAGALATTIVIMGLLRWLGGYHEYLGLDQFWSLAKIQLALGLFWFYFFWSEFIVMWYGRTPREQKIVELVMYGPYLLPFILTVIGVFLAPFLMLIWNKVRVSIVGPFVVSCFVLVGLYFDRVRLFVSAYTVENLYVHEMASVPPTHYPDLADVLLVIGGFAGVALSILLATRVVPAISLWEVKEALVLRLVRPYLATAVRIIGKPR